MPSDKAKAFISYCFADDRKRKILQTLLKNSGIEPLVVATQAEPAKHLSIKVKESINNSNYLIPILTSQSVSTQWINQEIGYAEKLVEDGRIKIIPIVSEDVFQILKGFIHNQMDLPFKFKTSLKAGAENKLFKSQCTLLVNYLVNLGGKSIIKNLLHPVFTNIFLSNYDPSGFIELDSFMTIKNLGDETLAIKEIRIDVDLELDDDSTSTENRYIFHSDSYKNDGGNKIELKNNPILIKKSDLITIKHLHFKSKFIVKSEKRYFTDTKIRYRFKNIETINGKFIFHDGKILDCNFTVTH